MSNTIKTRTTGIKIFITKELMDDENLLKDFLNCIFDTNKFTETYEIKKWSFDWMVRGVMRTHEIDPILIEALTEADINITKLPNYKAYSEDTYVTKLHWTGNLVKTILNIDSEVSFDYRSYDVVNNTVKYYIAYIISTSGKTKNEIKSIHKKNALIFINHLKSKKVEFEYDCNWSYKGNKACNL